MSSVIPPLRRPWLAALLAFVGGPVGHMYAGRLRRGLVLWVIWIPLTLLLLMLIHFVEGWVGIGAWMLCYLVYSLYFIVDAYRIAKQPSSQPRVGYQRWWAYLLMYVACAFIANGYAEGIRYYATEAFVIPTRSMMPTLVPGDRLLVEKFWRRPSTLQRNDLVVFRSAGPNSPQFVMRVVGLPGDRVEIRDEKVWLNGEEWSDPHGYFDPDLSPPPELSQFDELTIPPETFFVLGDNRRRSNDSRTLGPIPFADYHSRATLIYFSIERRFPDPLNTAHYENGSILWSRMGQRL